MTSLLFHVGLRDIDIEGALRRLADRRIEEAMREGKFSNLPGMGKPIDLEPMPVDENARLTWWALRILKNNDFAPDEVRWRKQIDLRKVELESATTAPRVAAIVKTINALVLKINTLGTNALNAPVTPLVLETELKRLKERSGG